MLDKTRKVICIFLFMAAIMIISIADQCSADSVSYIQYDYSSENYGSIMCLPVFYKDEYLYDSFVIRSYYCENKKDGQSVKIAESFGFEICDYNVDIDNDGTDELCCNCVYGGDGINELRVYKLINNAVYVGIIDKSLINMDDYRDFGAGAFQSAYDPESGDIVVNYATGDNYETRSVVVDVSSIQYDLYCEISE